MSLRKIPASDIKDITSLFGEYNKYERKLQELFDIKISVIEDEIWLKGQDQDSLDKAKNIIGEMIQVNKDNKHMDDQTFQYIVDQYQFNEGELKNGVYKEIKDSSILFKKIKAKTLGQKNYIEMMKESDIVFSIGPAGTGKTYLAVARAVESLRAGDVQRIILTRPAVEAGEKLGFLPGTLTEKIDPYLKPLYDALMDLIPLDRLNYYKENEIIEIVPLAYMRGRTLNNSFIILDEAQNTTYQQMKMFLTRIGFNSKAVVTGDITQIDLEGNTKSGLVVISSVLKNIDGIGFSRLTSHDVVRNPLVKKIIKAYDEFERKKRNNK